MENSVRPKRIQEKRINIDASRSIATFMIVCFHSMLSYSANGGIPVFGVSPHHIVGGIFLWGRVPFFFILCGFLASKSLSKPEASSGRFIKTRLKGLGIPYLFWNAVTICAHILAGTSAMTQNHTITQSPGSMIESLFGLGLSPADRPMWFVRDLILAHCLAPFLFKVRRWMMVPAMLLIAVPSQYGKLYGFEIPYLSSFGYYMIGMLLYDFELRELRALFPSPAMGVLLCAALGLITVFLGVGNLGVMGTLLGACAILLFGQAIEQKSPRVTTWLCALSSSSFLVYAVNGPILMGIQRVQACYWHMENTTMLVFYSLIPVVITLGAWGFHSLVQRNCPKLLLVLTGGR